jgi:hypothetical protein
MAKDSIDRQGYPCKRCRAWDGYIRLAEIELMPAWQGRGIGSPIVRWLMKEGCRRR